MDERYYMLGALGLLLVGLLAYLVVSLVRYRAAINRVRTARAQKLEGEARYLSPSAEHAEDVFAMPVTGSEATAADSLHSKVFDFDIPQVHVPAAQPAQSTPLEQQVVLAPEPEPVAETLPEPVAETPPVRDSGPVLEPAAEVESLREPQVASAPTIPEDLASLDLEPELPEEPAHGPSHVSVPRPTQSFTAEPILGESGLQAVPEQEPEPAPEPEPEAAPEPAPVLEAAPEAARAPEQLPGYSLADELERLVAAASTVSAPLLTPAEHEAVVSSATAEVAESEPKFEAVPETLFPAPSPGQALSTAAPAPLLAGAQSDQTPETPAPAPLEQTVMARIQQPIDVPEYTLVAPVELHFTAGEGRVGVKQGTRSHAEFQRLAGILLDDLRMARGR